MTDSQTFDVLNLEDDEEDKEVAVDSDFPEVDWLKPVDEPKQDTFLDDKMLPYRVWAILTLGGLLFFALMSRKETHDSRLYYDGTNAVQVTHKKMKLFWYERCECKTNTNVKVIRNGKDVEVVGLTD